MAKIYDNAFKVGALFALTVFVSLNYRSYEEAQARYQEWINRERDIEFSNYPTLGPVGWPIDWDYKFGVLEGGGGMLNLLTLAVLMFAFGFLFRQIWLKWRSNKNGTRINAD